MLGNVRLRALRKHASSASSTLVRGNSTWASYVSRSSSRVQTHVSSVHDPFLNLSIEHFLLENAPKDSYVLFLYVNRPCVVLGRNQNPWLELNLHALSNNDIKSQLAGQGSSNQGLDLVRRRSGGGTVFHDEGNVNWTVICPSDEFTRDKHAEMVVRALRDAGVDRARVNERHDIVLDQGSRGASTDKFDYHRTAYTHTSSADGPALKISGSAYKLTRGRALHHGTCLLQSPNLSAIGRYLRSPARGLITAKGVESVSSPIANVGIEVAAFQALVLDQFRDLYGSSGVSPEETLIGESALDVPELRKGYEELQTPEWTFGQTPQFTFAANGGTTGSQSSAKVYLSFRNCEIRESSITFPEMSDGRQEDSSRLSRLLDGRRLWHGWQWSNVLQEADMPGSQEELIALGQWLDQVLPTGHFLRQYVSNPQR